MSKKNLMAIIRENRTLLIVIAVGLFLIELEIFVIAAMKSGNKSVIQVKNVAGDVIYESDGNNLSQFDKYYFEQNFGPLDQYRLNLVSRQTPFPFRAWFVAAFGLFDTFNIIFSSAIKGAGDTRFVMLMMAVVSTLLLALPAYLAIIVLGCGLMVSWTILTINVAALGLVFYFRFLGGKWKNMRVIEEAPKC